MAVSIAVVVAAPGAGAGEGRRMLNEAEAVSWRGVGRVNIAGTRFCTGTLIDDRHVLTAAHCVFNPRTRAPVAPGMMHFVAGLRLGRHVGSQRVEAVATLPEYVYGEATKARQVAADVALLRLARPMRQDLAPPFRTGGMLAGDGLFIVSYARDRAHAPSIERQCSLDGRRGVIAILSCDVQAGSSGAPVFSSAEGRATVVAVVSARTNAGGAPKALAVNVEPALARLRALLPPEDGSAG